MIRYDRECLARVKTLTDSKLNLLHRTEQDPNAENSRVALSRNLREKRRGEKEKEEAKTSRNIYKAALATQRSEKQRNKKKGKEIWRANVHRHVKCRCQ